MDIAVLGLGNVGSNALRIISEKNSFFREKFGFSIRVTSVSDSRHTLYDENGLDISRVLHYKEKGNLPGTGYSTIDQEDIPHCRSDAIIDLSPATQDGIRGRDRYISAFGNGKDVVTANKAPLALHWAHIMRSARKNNRKIRFESAVAGGVPLFNMREFSLSPSDVVSFRGIVSSTVNFVLRRMISGGSFDDAVKEAQAMRIAEADYHDDTMGVDAARKTVILSNALFNTELTLNDIFYEGVEEQQERISELASRGGTYRIVSDIRREGGRITAGSRIGEIKDGDPLLVLRETSLGYVIGTDFNGDVLVAGFHDGPIETASGVVNDILLLGRTYRR